MSANFKVPAPDVGKLIASSEDARRDAIHVAVAPVEAGEDVLHPGQRVTLRDGKAVYAEAKEYCVGVVDPFLLTSVYKGERFWLFILPNTVTSLRHSWTHPAFKIQIPGFKFDSKEEA